MRCPFCFDEDSKVVDSRTTADGVKRRRECTACNRRFTTYERVQVAGVYVIKKDGRREEFSREKLLAGVRKACQKRPLPADAVEGLGDYVEAVVLKQGAAELPSTYVGELVMERLRALDEIAYIRFASVYRSFADVEALKEELAALEGRRGAGRTPSPPGSQLPLLGQDELKAAPRRPTKDGAVTRLVRGRRRPAEEMDDEEPIPEAREAGS
ncbi:MAG: transcriptional repressor NrdR [Dehalococcoidia bacterium]|nr:transcriptional repressor NrdR [Dehalococcoidia bacterium]